MSLQMSIDPILAQASSAILVSWWQAILIALPFFGWGYLVPKLEKDARYFHLPHMMWNGIHLGAGVAALAAMLLIPIFWVGWPVGLILISAPVMVYWQYRNNNVPEDKKFKLSSETITQKLESRRLAKATRDVVLQFTDSKGKSRQAPLKDDPKFPVQVLAEDLLIPALDARSSHIKLAATPKGCTVSQYVDGVRYDREVLQVEPAIQLMDMLKDIAGADVADRRRQQSGSFTVSGPNGKVEVHMVTAGSSNGQVMRLDFDRAARINKPFDALGLLPPQLKALKALGELEERHGIILVGAPSGHGLTTTSYSLLNRHDAFTSNIKSLEHDVQVRLDGVDQQVFDPTSAKTDLATTVQSILRRDPDVVLVFDVSDPETAKVLTEPGMDGPLLYVPQRAASIAEHLKSWFKQVGDAKKAVKPLRLVMNQRLLRSVCPNCRQSYQPTPEQLKKLNLPASKVKELFHASGKIQVKNKIESCPVCNGTGYLGQVGIFEVMVIDSDIRKLLIDGDLKGALAHARRNKMIYMQEAALHKVVAGETTIEEVIRVTAPNAARKAGTSKPPAAV
jgi:type II secretory ATPase GspE/PulE/Tfp pilus assembly ATPase PilB-like protein